MTSVITDAPSPRALLNRRGPRPQGPGTDEDLSVMVTDEMSIATISKEPKASRCPIRRRHPAGDCRAARAAHYGALAMMSGSVFQMTLTSGRRGVDGALVAAMVSVPLDGVRLSGWAGREEGPVAP